MLDLHLFSVSLRRVRRRSARLSAVCGGARSNVDAVAVQVPLANDLNSFTLLYIPLDWITLLSGMQRIITTKITYSKVLDFWFGPKSSPDYLQEKSFWYGSPADDVLVRNTLGNDYEIAKQGELDRWMQEGQGEGALALILLLDQVPRNVFRGKPQAYATDSKALTAARYAVDHGWDKEMPSTQRRYLYSPFNHSEEMKDQAVSLRLFTELGDQYHLHWAKSFYEEIKRNGRFVHRDRILGR
ncbi:hypothetical protein ASPWEDRAFT_30276 [Aspergillus wentii DTO 134E9]|uniref:DUF924-domain-containing protein n=1 Tax=Aspergillus wentii DTO 134E9 TaxID=1073089 RepID=A0A1L9RE04_ASPWE|nr:uncharacterized protein ASPWEDRAFT_30276 [Aspergillus wentii DTO 134E9]KAI9933431.1 hypothetical protein MW887_007904 [Aspergillus wentii]OJJ33169.1 hypothetical protein ASPWEDRAFT_30276 [Aspergillus wentii DTO 134E9]